jgi:peptidyl-prolyl cis-trans isomerase SurA
MSRPASLMPRPAQTADRIETRVKTMFRKSVSGRIALGLGIAATLGLALPAGSAGAQDGGGQVGQGGLNIPDNVKLFGRADPNLRRPTAVVNGEIITGTDVDQRLALILAANDNKPSAEEVSRLKLQVLRNLIDETLQIQEALANKIEITNDEVEQTYARVAQQNFKQSVPSMNAYLVKVGSSPASLKRQITGELAWQRLLRRNVQPFINVSEEEVKEVLERLKASKGTEEYRLGEIFLSATPDSRAAVEENAKRIVGQLREGGSFVAYARQFSEASTAAVGGDLGWIRLAQLPPELSTVARDLQAGQLVGPVQVRGGFSILYMIDKRQVLTADPRDALLSLKQVSINFPPGLSEADANKRAADFATAMRGARGCGTVDAIAHQAGAEVVANDQVRARDLPGQLLQIVLDLQIGQTSPPFGTIKDGVRVLMLCGRDDPKVNEGPSFDDLMTQMEDERVNKRAQMYLRDLRRDAIIDYQ